METGAVMLTVAALAMLIVLGSVSMLASPRDLLRAAVSTEFRYALLLSLGTATVSTAVALATSIVLAYYSRLDGRVSRVAETILSLPMAMPPIALGVALLAFFTRNPLGVLIDRLVGVAFSIPGIIAAQYFVILPLMVRGVRTAFDAVPDEVIGVARTLGYRPLEVLFRVVLPASSRGVAAAAILGFARALGEFGASVMVAGATRLKTETIPIAIYLAMESGELGLAAAMTIVSLVAAALVMTVMEGMTGWRH